MLRVQSSSLTEGPRTETPQADGEMQEPLSDLISESKSMV